MCRVDVTQLVVLTIIRFNRLLKKPVEGYFFAGGKEDAATLCLLSANSTICNLSIEDPEGGRKAREMNMRIQAQVSTSSV